MAIDHDDQSRIEAYLRGELSPEETVALEAEASKDERLQEELSLAKIHYLAMEQLVEEELKTNLHQWIKAQDEAPKSKTSIQWWWWLGGLALTSLALLIWYILTPSTTPDYTPIEFEPRTIDSTNHKPNPLPKDINVPNKVTNPLPPVANTKAPDPADPRPTGPSSRGEYLSAAELVAENTLPAHLNSLFRDGGSASDTSILNTAIAYFSDKKYSSAIQTLKQISPQSQQYESAQEWLAYSYFYAKNFAAAAPLFEQLIEADNGRPFTESAEWFLILCLTDQYRQHKTTVSSMLQNIIDQPSHRYHEQARQLQQRLAQ